MITVYWNDSKNYRTFQTLAKACEFFVELAFGARNSFIKLQNGEIFDAFGVEFVQLRAA